MALKTLFKILCLSLVFDQVVALTCHMRGHTNNTVIYKLSHVPGKNCHDYWAANRTSLVHRDDVLGGVILDKGIDYVVTMTCMPLMKYMADCEDGYSEAECDGICPTNSPVEAVSKGNTYEAYLMVPFCLGLKVLQALFAM